MDGYQARDMIKREGYIAPVYLIRHTIDMLFGIKTICADLDLYMALQSESNPDPNSDPAFKLQITVSPPKFGTVIRTYSISIGSDRSLLPSTVHYHGLN
jgi:hypothetical protein